MPGRFMERFGKFKHTQIHISIDGTKDTYEYIRYPGKWSVVERNIKKLAGYIESAENIGAEAHVVFQSYNMHNICDLLKYFNQFKEIKNFETMPYFINTYHPWHSRIGNVPLKYRKRIGFSKVSGTLKGAIFAGIKILYWIVKYSFVK